MKHNRIVVCLLFSLIFTGCTSSSRHRILTILFEGVPERKKEESQQKPVILQPAAATVGYTQHGPYAAKACDSCHEPGTNRLVAPPEELCFRCHEFPQNKKYIHGPLASGGCLICHDPHSSSNRFLLVSDSDTFCLHCHEKPHTENQINCTSCHDAHMSDQQYLLKP